MAASGCSDDAKPGATDSGAVDSQVGSDGGPLDTQTDVGGVDIDVGADAGPVCPGGAGCACSGPADCDSAACIEASEGRVCTRKCVEGCPFGNDAIGLRVSNRLGAVPTLGSETRGFRCALPW
ncbi:MAG: hypothetical protein RIT45_4061 [Pseudomonadota bacterium]